MLIYNFKNVINLCANDISYYISRLSKEDPDDCKQEIYIHIYKNLDNFNPERSSLKSFLNLMIMTAYRKIVFDKTKQAIFDNNVVLCEDIYYDGSCYDEREQGGDSFVGLISNKISNPTTIAVLYSLIYNSSDKYTVISRKINIPHSVFLFHVKIIKHIVSAIIQEIKK